MDLPRYSLDLYDNYTTADGEDLSIDCAQQYDTEFTLQAVSMVEEVNTKISGGVLCPADNGRIIVSAVSSNFVSQGSWVRTFAKGSSSEKADNNFLDDSFHTIVGRFALFSEE